MSRLAPCVAVVACLVVQRVDGTAQTGELVTITLERTPCFGTCPAYTVRIMSDGRVEYEGRRFVRVVGKATATIPLESVQELVRQFDRIGYFELKDKYTAMITDLPTTTTSIRKGARFKQIVDYYGAPPALKDLERRIDEAAGSVRWVSVDADTVRALRKDGWTAAREDGAAFLREAVQRGDSETVAALLEAGADPDGDQSSVLTAARKGSIVKQLAAAGAIVDFADVSGRTPLLFAARWLEPDVVAALLESKANPNLSGPGGETPLMAAVRGGRAENVRLLLHAGARVSAVNEAGQTALDAAQQAKNEPPPRSAAGPSPPRELDTIIGLLKAAAR